MEFGQPNPVISYAEKIPAIYVRHEVGIFIHKRHLAF